MTSGVFPFPYFPGHFVSFVTGACGDEGAIGNVAARVRGQSQTGLQKGRARLEQGT